MGADAANAFAEGAGFAPGALLSVLVVMAGGSLIVWMVWSLVQTLSAFGEQQFTTIDVVREMLWTLVTALVLTGLLGFLVAAAV